MTTGPELGAYLYCLAVVFSLLSLIVSVGAILHLYCCVPMWKRRNEVQDQADAADPRQKDRDKHAERNQRHQPAGNTARVHHSNDIDAGVDMVERGMRSGSGSGSDTDDVHDEGKNLSIRVRGSAAGADRIKSPSIADSIDGSLKVDSPRNPRPTPPIKPPKPSRLMGTRPGAAGGGGQGQDQVDRETEVVPYSPPSISPKKKEAQTLQRSPQNPQRREQRVLHKQMTKHLRGSPRSL